MASQAGAGSVGKAPLGRNSKKKTANLIEIAELAPIFTSSILDDVRNSLGGHITAVEIPSYCEDTVDSRKRCIKYEIVVTNLAGSKWKVAKRYSDFLKLQQEVSQTVDQAFTGITHYNFPEKKFGGFNFDPEVIEDRRLSFQQYLRILVALQPPPGAVNEFLRSPQWKQALDNRDTARRVLAQARGKENSIDRKKSSPESAGHAVMRRGRDKSQGSNQDEESLYAASLEEELLVAHPLGSKAQPPFPPSSPADQQHGGAEMKKKKSSGSSSSSSSRSSPSNSSREGRAARTAARTRKRRRGSSWWWGGEGGEGVGGAEREVEAFLAHLDAHVAELCRQPGRTVRRKGPKNRSRSRREQRGPGSGKSDDGDDSRATTTGIGNGSGSGGELKNKQNTDSNKKVVVAATREEEDDDGEAPWWWVFVLLPVVLLVVFATGSLLFDDVDFMMHWFATNMASF